MKNEFVYNPENYGGHSHAATIVEHKGELYLSWYVYQEKEHEKGQIVYAKYDRAKGAWPKADFAFLNMRGSNQGNPVLFSLSDKLNLFFVVLKGNYWDSAQIFSSTLDEETNTWSSPIEVNTEQGIMVRHRPIIFNSTAVVPAYDEKSMSTILYQFDTDINKWTEYSRFSGEYIQGDILSFNNEECQMYLRAAGDNNKVMKTISSNKGKDWTIVRETSLHCPLSGIAAIALKSGKILVCNNHTKAHRRSPISLNLSSSQGINFDLGTWHVDKTEIELSYPTLFQEENGLIHLAFTFNRKMIKHIAFTEEELLERLSLVEQVNA